MFISVLYKNQQLVGQMVKREIVGRYRGSFFGIFWSFFNPLIMLAVYTFVFSYVFNARWSIGSDSKTEFALALFIGMIAHGVISECLNRSPLIILDNTSYVKKVVFPLEILPWVLVGAASFHSLISLLVWVVGYLLINQSFNWTAVFTPLILLPLLFYSLAISWFLSALSVYVRDIAQITGVISTVLLFMSPVFYPASALPEQYQIIFNINPLTLIIESLRAVMMWGQLPAWQDLAFELLKSIFVAWLAFKWFQKARVGFSDVL